MDKKIDKQEFIDLITNYINLTDNIDKLDQLLHACIYESKDYKFIDNMFYKILKVIFRFTFIKTEYQSTAWFIDS